MIYIKRNLSRVSWKIFLLNSRILEYYFLTQRAVIAFSEDMIEFWSENSSYMIDTCLDFRLGPFNMAQRNVIYHCFHIEKSYLRDKLLDCFQHWYISMFFEFLIIHSHVYVLFKQLRIQSILWPQNSFQPLIFRISCTTKWRINSK